ncbi:MAG: hypothetical protein P1V13_13945 [Rhizobiaceae bacterium]|nr:hypothetical protein [Rhizobiaceae bacterium]
MTIPRGNDRIMLGRKSVYANECHEGQFIGSDWDMDFDLSGKVPENRRDFNKQFNPVFAESYQVSYIILNN